MSNLRIIGCPNETAQAYTVVQSVSSSPYIPAAMPLALLKTDAPTERSRITTLDPFYTVWGVDTSLIPLTVEGLALGNHNVADGGQVRFVGWDSVGAGPLNLPNIVVPVTVLASTNMTGAVGNIDEVPLAAPDGSSMGPTTTTSAWSVTLRFAEPASPLNTGVDGLALVVRVRRVFTGAGATNPTTLPVLTASLTAPAKALGYRAVTVSATGGQFLIFPFRSSDVTSLADLQATLAFTPGTSPSGGQYAVLEVAAVYYESITATTPTYTSDWITVQTTSRRAAIAPTQHVHYFPPTPWTDVVGYGVCIRSDQAAHDPLTTATGLVPAGVVPVDPVSYVEAGVFPAGEILAPAAGIRKGSGPMGGRPEAISLGGATAGGQSYAADAYRLRSSPPLEVIVTRDELLTLQDQVAYRKGNHLPFYVAVEPDVASTYQMFSAYWATLKSMSEPRPHGSYKSNGSMKFVVELQFVEKL